MAKKSKESNVASEQVNNNPSTTTESLLSRMYRHYAWGVQDMDTRRTRKNGWNELIDAYMGKIPVKWPFNSVVTNPLIRTTIMEKTSRLLNAKLQGRLIPRHNSEYIKAKVCNTLLDFQWDNVQEGGSMIEKVALTDQYARIFGAAFVIVYWDVKRMTNEIKVIDPRDMFFDGSANHIKNAKWVQVREFTTFDKLEQRGYDVKDARDMAMKGEISAEMKSSRYESIVKANRGIIDRTGMIDDLRNPVIETATEWGYDVKANGEMRSYEGLFLPKYGLLLDERENPYKHKKIPVSMLRYYPLIDDIYGESECESVLPLQRAINAFTCGLIDEANIKMRPPLKISASGVRIETIEYGPGAHWIMQNPNQVVELEPNGGYIQAFNTVYPMLLAAFNTAMGDQSVGVSNLPPFSTDKTATEIKNEERQQNSRDQYNQLYLGEFLKDIMLMWQSNNKQYLFDDPQKQHYIVKIIGKDNIQEFQQMRLDEMEIPDFAMNQIADTIRQNPNAVPDGVLNEVVQGVMVPKNPVITNPSEKPQNYTIKNKLDIKSPTEAELYLTPTDFEGTYDYVADVKSMAAGAGTQAQQGRQQAYQMMLTNPQVLQLLQMQGETLKIKELLVSILEDAGDKDAEALFKPADIQNGQQPGAGTPQPGQMAPGANGMQGIQGVPQAIPHQPSAGGIPRPGNIQGQGQTVRGPSPVLQ